MVQGQNFHVLNADKISTEKKWYIIYIGIWPGPQKMRQKCKKLTRREIKILLYFKYEPAMKEVLKVVYAHSFKCKTCQQFKNFLEEIYNKVFPDSTRQFDSVR